MKDLKDKVAFVTGAPRYLFGEYITPPNPDDAGNPLAADSNYWRQQPVQPGENFTHPAGPQLSDRDVVVLAAALVQGQPVAA